MGNEMSVPQKIEAQMNEASKDSSQIAPESGCIQNGLLIVQQKNDANAETSVNQGKMATSSHKTMEISTVSEANGKNLGKEAKDPAPAAKSRFFLPFSRPVPGRTRDQGTDSSVGSVSLDVSSEKPPSNKASSENMKLPVTAALEENSDKTESQVPAEASFSATEQPASPPPEAEGEVPAKPKEPRFLNKFFKLDKKRENIPVPTGIQEGTNNKENQHLDTETPGLSSQSNNVPEEKDIVDSKKKGGKENPEGVHSSDLEDTEKPEIVQENPQTINITENSNSVMSFFKTLVSSNKAESKTDSEEKGSKAEKVHDGPAGQKTTEVQAKGAKKKHPESPRIGYAFRKFFRHKSSKEIQSTSNTKGAEKSPASSANTKSDKATSSSPEAQGTQKNTKGLDSSAQQQTTASSELAKNGAKEKAGPTSLPLGKLFWKKSIKEDTVPKGAEENQNKNQTQEVFEAPKEVIKSEEIEVSLQTIELNEEEAISPEPDPAKPNAAEENKPQRAGLKLFFRQLSLKVDEEFTSAEVNGKDSNGQTSDSTEKAVTPPETEPAGPGQKNKESSKDKKPTADQSKQKGNKQEAKEQVNSPDQHVAEKNSMQNGANSKESPLKRTDKGQSFGNFFRGLRSKRMTDAEVQTDPVSIGPVGKSK